MALEYVCDVVKLKPSDCMNGYTHWASLYATDGKGRYLRNHARGRSGVDARATLAVYVVYMRHADSQKMQDAIEAAGKEMAAR